MLKFELLVDYTVSNRDEMVAWIERNFGMRPEGLLDEEGVHKEAHYRVGSTVIRFREPAPGHEDNQFLEKNGPGVQDVTWWRVDNISEVVQQLKAKGITLQDEQGYHRSKLGYCRIDIDPKDSHNVRFRLAGQLK